MSTEPPEHPAESSAPSERVVGERLCIGCGYDLRGIDEQGNCPECGLAVARSEYRAFFKFAELQWLRQVRRGVLLMIGCHIILLLSPFLVGFVVVQFEPGLGWLVAGGFLWILALALAGWWIGSPDRESAAWPSGRGRWAVPIALRIVSVLFLMLCLVLLLIGWLAIDADHRAYRLWRINRILTGFAAAMPPAIVLLSLMHIRLIAKQADRALARNATRAVALIIILFALVIAEAIGGSVLPLGLLRIAGCVTIILAVIAFFFGATIFANFDTLLKSAIDQQQSASRTGHD